SAARSGAPNGSGWRGGVRREGASNCGRGARAPHFQVHPSDLIEARGMSSGARALARFTVRSEKTLEVPGPLSLRTLKRRERRASGRSLFTICARLNRRTATVDLVFLFAALARHEASSVHAAWS